MYDRVTRKLYVVDFGGSVDFSCPSWVHAQPMGTINFMPPEMLSTFISVKEGEYGMLSTEEREGLALARLSFCCPQVRHPPGRPPPTHSESMPCSLL
jgi:hypothetical protein